MLYGVSPLATKCLPSASLLFHRWGPMVRHQPEMVKRPGFAQLLVCRTLPGVHLKNFKAFGELRQHLIDRFAIDIP